MTDRTLRLTYLASLGEGAEAVVLRARLREAAFGLDEGTEVAVKAPRDPGPRAAARIRAEADAAATIASPHLVAVHGTAEARVPGLGTRQVLVSAVAPGEPLDACLRRDGPLGTEDLRRVASAAAGALARLHAAGWVHGDVKPEHLVVAPDGSIRLIDLGFAARRGDADPAVGTPAYASPARLLGGGVADARDDVHALGAALFELATGAPPHGGGSVLSVVRRSLAWGPLPCRAQAPHLDRDLAALIDAMIDPDEARRPSDGAEVLRRLAGGTEPMSSVPPEATAVDRTGVESADVPLPLVGRSSELERLTSALRPSAVVVVVGAAGAGKSRLVHEATRQRPVAFTSAGRDDPGTLLADLLRGLLEGTYGPAMARAMPAGLAALAGRIRSGQRPEPLERWAAACLEGAILAPDLPTPILVVDEAHALTAAEATSLRGLRASPVGRAAALVLVARSAGRTLDAIELLAGATATVEVGALDGTSVDRLAQAAGAGPSARAVLLPALLAATDGNASLVALALRALARRGAFARGAEDWPALLAPLAAAEALPASERLSRAAFDGLDDEGRAVLEAAGVLGARFDPWVLSKVLALPPIRVLRHVAILERTYGILALEGTSVAFVPSALAEAVVLALPADRRRSLHARAGAVLAPADPERVRHLLAAGAGGETLAEAAVAVRTLRTAGALTRAMALADEALGAAGHEADAALRFDVLLERERVAWRLPAFRGLSAALCELEAAVVGLDPGRRAAALRDRAFWRYAITGDPRAAVREAGRAYRLLRAAGLRGEALTLAVDQLTWTSEAAASPRHRRLERAVAAAAARGGDHDLHARVQRLLARAARARGDVVAAARHVRTGLTAARTHGLTLREVELREERGDVLSAGGRARAAVRSYRRSGHVAATVGLWIHQASAVARTAGALVDAHRPRAALRLLRGRATLIASFASLGVTPRAAQARARARVVLGHGRAALEELTHWVASLGSGAEARIFWAVVAQVAAVAGDREACARAVCAARGGGRGGTPRPIRSLLTAAFMRAEVARGRFPGALRWLRRCAEATLEPAAGSGPARDVLVWDAAIRAASGHADRRGSTRAVRAVRRVDDRVARALAAAAYALALPGRAALSAAARRAAGRVRYADPVELGLMRRLLDRLAAREAEAHDVP